MDPNTPLLYVKYCDRPEETDRLLQFANTAIKGDKDSLIEVYDSEYLLKFDNGVNLHSPYIAKINIEHTFNMLSKLIESLKMNNIKFIISGSTVLSSLLKDINFSPTDIDFYLIKPEPSDIKKFDKVVHDVYGEFKIIITRTKYLLNWWIIDCPHAPTIQLILPMVEHPIDIFVTYHSDMVCVGYDGEKFIYAKGRFDNFVKTKCGYITSLFQEESFHWKLLKIYTKYSLRLGYLYEISFIDIPVINKDTAYDTYPDQFNIKKYLKENDTQHVKISENIADLYDEEHMATALEVFSNFYKCPVCKIFNHKIKICDTCQHSKENK